MRKILTLLLLIPFISFAQTKYTSESKKLYNKALKAFDRGETDVAFDFFKECVLSEPHYAEAYLNMSIIEYGRDNMKEALAYSKEAYTQNKFQSPIYSQLGKCFFQNEQYDSSAYYLEKGIQLGANSENDFLYAGKSHLKLEDFHTAVKDLTKAIGINDKNPVSYNSRGSAYFNMGEYDKAEADYNKAIELNPTSAGIYSNLANAALAKENPEGAIEYINLGIENANESDKIQLLILLGNYYHETGDYKNATTTFDQAYAINNKSAVVLTNQAAVLLDQDMFESAIKKCNEALDINPEMMEAYYNRGIANEMMRNVEEACSDWEQAFILGSEKAEEFLNSPTCNE